ncbi:MAG: phosphoribosyltransferase family protein [Anaerolineae bacterium]
MAEQTYYTVEIAGLKRDLPLFEVAPGVSIAIFNMLGDTPVVEAAAAALAPKLPVDAEVLITPEVKSIPLAHALSNRLHIPYVVARKIHKPYMVNALSVEVVSITTGKPQTLWLDGKDRPLIEGKKVVIVDDVVSTGSTLKGLRELVTAAGGTVIAEAAVFTEGEEGAWPNVIALGHLPIFKKDQ